MNTDDRLIVAIDDARLSDVLDMAVALRGVVRFIKIGSTAFNANGPDLIKMLKAMEFSIFLDLKLFDIPYQVGMTVKEITGMGVDMLSLHALGGEGMMKEALFAASEEAGRLGVEQPLLIGVTVLTSLDEKWVGEIGVKSLDGIVESLVNMTDKAGLDGVVASSHEVAAIKLINPDLKVIVPGIRLKESDSADQIRVATPEDAIKDGADYLVVGRPVTRSTNSRLAAKEMIARINLF